MAHVFKEPKVLDPGSCFQRPRILGLWLMFSDDQGFFGLWLMFSEDQGFLGLWLIFSENQRFWILAHVFRNLGFLDLGSYFKRTKGFRALAHVFKGPKVLDPGSCFQRPRILGLWLMFSEDQRFWILPHVFRDIGFLGLSTSF